MKNLFIVLMVLLVLGGCISTPEPVKIPGESCIRHSECILDEKFAMQSNCPFEAACVDGKCNIICQMKTQQKSGTTCILDADCNCDSRGNKTIECVCVDNQCVSVEAQ